MVCSSIVRNVFPRCLFIYLRNLVCCRVQSKASRIFGSMDVCGRRVWAAGVEMVCGASAFIFSLRAHGKWLDGGCVPERFYFMLANNEMWYFGTRARGAKVCYQIHIHIYNLLRDAASRRLYVKFLYILLIYVYKC